MKALMIITGIILSLLLGSCTRTTESEHGHLTIYNDTNGLATVSFDSKSSVTIPAQSQFTKFVDTFVTNTVNMSYTGDYVTIGNGSKEVLPNQTVFYDIYPNSGRLSINNNSANQLLVTSASKNDEGSAGAYGNCCMRVCTTNITTGVANYRYQGLYIMPQNTSAPMITNEMSITTVNADAGAININNRSNSIIQHVYMSPSNQSVWGPDILSANFNAGTSAVWSALPGNWDIRLVDNLGNAYMAYSQNVTLNTTLFLELNDRKATIWQNTDRKQAGNSYFTPAVQYFARNK